MQSRIFLRNRSFFPPFSRGVSTIQGGGLFLLTIVSFFPVFFHIEEILFFSFLGLALFAKWFEGKDLRIRTPIDLPLLLLLGWIFLTIPFSLNPEYSFMEWRKLVAQCLVFYWAVSVMRDVSHGTEWERNRRSSKWLNFIVGKNSSQKVFLAVIIGT